MTRAHANESKFAQVHTGQVGPFHSSGLAGAHYAGRPLNLSDEPTVWSLRDLDHWPPTNRKVFGTLRSDFTR
jgi:hypothetical protein